jgi:catalase
MKGPPETWRAKLGLPPAGRPVVVPLAVIGLVACGTAAAFAYTAGWFSPDRLSPNRMVNALSERGGDPLGHRRNHSKGICFTGYFAANGAGTRLSKAPVFVTGQYPVVGRFAIAVGDPMAPDATGRVRSMAVRMVAPDGQEWRMGINAMPFFPVATLKAFYDLTAATDIVPATGKPDPAAVPHFVAAHPEFLPFLKWATTAPWTTSFADQAYNSINAFRFIDATGDNRAVRWSMQPSTAPTVIAPADLAKLPPDFLETDLKKRLATGELRWTLMVTLAGAGDPTNDATKVWPADRERVDVGTLVIQKAEDEANGPCRDYNYDPLILPTGITGSDDPLLSARSAAYANSFDRRTAESADYSRTPKGDPQ